MRKLFYVGLISLFLLGCISLQEKMASSAENSLRILTNKVGCGKKNSLFYKAKSGAILFHNCGTGYTAIRKGGNI